MFPRPSGGMRRRRAIAFCFAAALASLPGIFRASAQTPQPWLFVETLANGKVTGAVTFLRDDSSGALTQLANSQTTFTNPCGPSAIDPRRRFLCGYCANGLSMYTVDAITGAVREVATSPYRVERNAREFHGDSDDQRQRHGCANGSDEQFVRGRLTIRPLHCCC